jgi:acyl-CoA thioester hydrolase
MGEQKRSNSQLSAIQCSNNTNFILPIRVYYEDTDAGGVVYHSKYINFFERARSELMRHIGYELDELAKKEKLLFVVRAISCDYLLPAKFNDELFVSAVIIAAGKTRIQFEQKVMKAGNAEDKNCITLAEGKVTVVSVDAEKFKPKRLPTKIIENIRGNL